MKMILKIKRNKQPRRLHDIKPINKNELYLGSPQRMTQKVKFLKMLLYFQSFYFLLYFLLIVLLPVWLLANAPRKAADA